jgi:hypothetical protein
MGEMHRSIEMGKAKKKSTKGILDTEESHKEKKESWKHSKEK